MIDLIPPEREDLLAVVSLAASGLRALGDWEERLATARAHCLTIPPLVETSFAALVADLRAWQATAQDRLREMSLAISAAVEAALSETGR